ncbi:MAG TPA: hypothetical protein VFG23_08410 [Polyangia bacterium]|nr:hypothetical protein [Polyangia bacterium]
MCSRGHDNATPNTRTPRGSCRECGRDRDRARHRKEGCVDIKVFCRNRHRRTPENTGANGCQICLQINTKAKYERLMNDPERHEALKEYQRIYAEAKRRRAGVAPRNWGAKSNRGGGTYRRILAAPFLGWLDAYLEINQTSLSTLCAAAGYATPLSPSHLRRYRRIQITTVGRLLDAAGCGDQWHALYPTENGAEIPLALEAPRPAVVTTAPPRRCRSGDDCAHVAGHGPNGRFCEHHGAELDRIFAVMQAEHLERSEVAKARSARGRQAVPA